MSLNEGKGGEKSNKKKGILQSVYLDKSIKKLFIKRVKAEVNALNKLLLHFMEASDASL